MFLKGGLLLQSLPLSFFAGMALVAAVVGLVFISAAVHLIENDEAVGARYRVGSFGASEAQAPLGGFGDFAPDGNHIGNVQDERFFAVPVVVDFLYDFNSRKKFFSGGRKLESLGNEKVPGKDFSFEKIQLVIVGSHFNRFEIFRIEVGTILWCQERMLSDELHPHVVESRHVHEDVRELGHFNEVGEDKAYALLAGHFLASQNVSFV